MKNKLFIINNWLKNTLKKVQGFSFIELILYVSLVTLILSALLPFTFNIISGSARSSVMQDVNSQARSISERIKYEIRNAASINSTTATSLSLNTPTNAVTVIDLSGGYIRITYGVGGTPVNLNASNTIVSALSFSNNTSLDFKSQNVQFSFTIDDRVNSLRKEYNVSAVTIQGTAEIRTPLPATPTPTMTPTPTPTLTPTITPSPTPVPPAWPFRKRITINESRINGSTALMNFLVLVNLPSDAGIAASNTQSNGNDIKFTAADGVTQLDHEIEYFVKATGQLVAWVRIPSLSATTNTDIYMYYGNPAAANQQDVTNTWNASSFRAVWHMDETSGTTLADTTPNGKTATKLTATEPNPATGLMGGGQTFDGSNDRAIVATPSLPTGDFTFSSWVNLTSTTNETLFMAADGSQDMELRIAVVSGKVEVILSGTSDDVTSSSSVTTGGWRHVAVTRGGSTIRTYINGVLDSNTGDDSDTLDFSSCYLLIGAHNSSYTSSTNNCTSTPTNFLSGSMDEARIVTNDRPTEWINAEYNNQSAPATFYTLGSQENL